MAHSTFHPSTAVHRVQKSTQHGIALQLTVSQSSDYTDDFRPFICSHLTKTCLIVPSSSGCLLSSRRRSSQGRSRQRRRAHSYRISGCWRVHGRYPTGTSASLRGKLSSFHSRHKRREKTKQKKKENRLIELRQDFVRKAVWIHYPYYKDKGHEFNDPVPILTIHLEHCIEILRQVVMCHADPGVIGHHFVRGYNNRPYPNFNGLHMCRNSESIIDWAYEHMVHSDAEKMTFVPGKDEIVWDVPP